MSDATYQPNVYARNNGDTISVDSGGTIQVLSGGSVQVADGGVVQVASGGSIDLASGGVLNIATGGSIIADAGVSIGTLVLGGTAARWAFGTATLTSGTALVYTGLGAVRSFAAFAITSGNNGTGAGTATSFQLDWGRAANGTVFAFGVTGTAAFTGAGTFAWQAFGV